MPAAPQDAATRISHRAHQTNPRPSLGREPSADSGANLLVLRRQGFLFPILYPDEQIIRLAFRGMAMYRLPWFDAHMWAFAEARGLSQLFSEDFQHGRWYGTVRIVNPFQDLR